MAPTDNDPINDVYMQTNFVRFLKALQASEETAEVEKDLYTTFAQLSQEDQTFAEHICIDIKSGDLHVDPKKTFADYLVEYRLGHKNDRIHKFFLMFGLDEERLRLLKATPHTINTLHQNNQFKDLIETVDWVCAKKTLEAQKLPTEPDFRLRSQVREQIQAFILETP